MPVSRQKREKVGDNNSLKASLDQVESKPIKGYEWRKLNVPSVLATRDPSFHTLSTIQNILTVSNSSQKENIKTEISGQEVIKYFDLSPFVDVVFKDRILESPRWSQTPDFSASTS